MKKTILFMSVILLAGCSFEQKALTPIDSLSYALVHIDCEIKHLDHYVFNYSCRGKQLIQSGAYSEQMKSLISQRDKIIDNLIKLAASSSKSTNHDESSFFEE